MAVKDCTVEEDTGEQEILERIFFFFKKGDPPVSCKKKNN